MTVMVILLTESIVWLFLLSVAMATKLSLTNGGYEDITFAINKNVPKSVDLVENLQILIQDASDSLYAATGLHMRTAAILVPSSWQMGDRNDKLTFSEADLRVDRPHPYYRDRPYTQPTWTCGAMQRYVHLTPGFVLGTTDGTRQKQRGILLANQFARYRWGVFDDVIANETGSTTMSKNHEKACRGVSVADIINNHDDHSQTGQTPTQPVSVTVVYNHNDQAKNPEEKECGRRVVLLLDDSFSMNEHSRAFRQNQVARTFIKDILPTSSEIGIIIFYGYSVMLVGLTKLTTEDDQGRIVDLVTRDRSFGPATGIGQALKDALALLEGAGAGADEEDRILLITDGGENPDGGPTIDDVMKDIIESKVMVHSIALGSDASKSLGELCHATGGVYGYYTEKAQSATLTQVVSNLWQDFNMLCVEDQPIEIVNLPLEVSKDKPVVEQPVPIDATVNKTVFQFTSPENSDIEVQIKDPENKTYDRNSPQHTEDPRLKVDKFTFDNPQPGEWNVTVRSKSLHSSPEAVIMTVKADPKEDSETYEVQSWLDSMIVKVPAVTRIYVSVTRGYSPLIKAKVTATVERPEADAVNVDLRDDGKGADVAALDGIYTGEFTGYTANDRYSLEIHVASVVGETVVVKELISRTGDSQEDVDLEDIEDKILTSPVEPMARTPSQGPGAFDVRGLNPKIDQFPPSPITDLVPIEVKDNVVTLQWTAPGDDWAEGTASEYEFRMWHDQDALRKDASIGILMTVENPEGGKYSPSPSRTTETLTIRLSDSWPFPFYCYCDT
ncbi:calcium-activated chloride channel regulator 1-like [Haliotis rufescens]|uniref:calcium-activated chloride channel regulator 1-like n=1 Tax=Haliotis rufescens TaxID=6454 RepID=UPI00201F3746|nr:calcium-activated chloride channel regulator 1-like [Haliotis rufescens]